MTLEDIISQGETKNAEFKRSLPDKSDRYMKSIVAFANTQGGYLIIGVEDGTMEVVGVDRSSVFAIMDSITNAVCDSCTPQIVPDITFQTIEGKTVVAVYVAPGANRPYYLTSKGKEAGTYIRVSGSSRPADPDKIRELEYEGARISWDEQVCIGCDATELSIRNLCRDINRYRRKMQDGTDVRELPRVTGQQLVNWGVLKISVMEGKKQYIATNAFALLTGTHFRYARTQCAVFAGTERGDFLDKQEFTGPLYEQIEQAYAFVMRNIRRSARVDGLIRRERYELPPAAIREMIINAHCHRNYLDSSCIQVALYDDRLEVTSPGGLCYGLTLDEALTGRSKQRNRVTAEVFSQMGLIEAWGTGLRKICRTAGEYGLPEPQFIEMPGTFRVNLFRQSKSLYYETESVIASEDYRNIDDDASEMHRNNFRGPSEDHRSNVSEASEDHRRIIGEMVEKRQEKPAENQQDNLSIDWKSLNDTQRNILRLLERNPKMTAAELSGQIGISRRNIEANIHKLKELGLLVRHGSNKSGYWEISGDHLL